MKSEANLVQNFPVNTSLTIVDMEQIIGGNLCLKGKTLGVATGFCLVGGLLNVGVGIGCAVWGGYHYLYC